MVATELPACLLLHGFGATPADMEPLAVRLRAAGHVVSTPLLPGHGGSVDDLARTFYPDWQAGAQAALHELAAQHQHIVLAGLSLGGTLCLQLAAQWSTAWKMAEPPQLCGLITLAAPVYLYKVKPWDMPDWRLPLVNLLSRVRPRWPKPRPPATPGQLQAHRECLHAEEYVWLLPQVHSLMQGMVGVRRELGRIRAPMLIMHARADATVSVGNAFYLARHVGAADVTMHLLHTSGAPGQHILPLHPDTAAPVAEAVVAFCRRVSPLPAACCAAQHNPHGPAHTQQA